MDEIPSQKLGRQLVRLAMGGDSNDCTVEILKSSDRTVWESAVWELRFHGVLPLIAHSLRTRNLESLVPDSVLAELKRTYRDTCLINQRFLNCLGDVLELFRSRGIEPVLWKGCALVASIWPDVGSRPMGDLDLLIDPLEMAAAIDALLSAGFQKGPAMYVNPAGISVDLQHLEFNHVKSPSDGSNLKRMTRMLTPQVIPTSVICCLEPNAMLARLAGHLARHSGGGSSMGISLRWLLDLHFVLRRWSAEIDAARLISLTDTDMGLAMLMRALGFFCREMGMHYEGSEKVQTLSMQFEPLSFDEILHSRRLGVWNLPTSEMGWLWFFGHHLRLRPRPGRLQPLLSDYVQIPRDWMRDNRMRRRAALLRKSGVCINA